MNGKRGTQSCRISIRQSVTPCVGGCETPLLTRRPCSSSRCRRTFCLYDLGTDLDRSCAFWIGDHGSAAVIALVPAPEFDFGEAARRTHQLWLELGDPNALIQEDPSDPTVWSVSAQINGIDLGAATDGRSRAIRLHATTSCVVLGAPLGTLVIAVMTGVGLLVVGVTSWFFLRRNRRRAA